MAGQVSLSSPFLYRAPVSIAPLSAERRIYGGRSGRGAVGTLHGGTGRCCPLDDGCPLSDAPLLPSH